MADDGTPHAKGFAQRIRNHPLVVVILAGVGAASVTAGAVGYLYTKQIDVLSTRFDTQLAAQEAKYEQRIFDLEQTHKADIGKLEVRLSSIERRLGDNDFFNVRHFYVEDPEGLEIAPGSKFFDDAGFYAPAGEGFWTYGSMTEVDFMRRLYGEDNPLFQMFLQSIGGVQSFGRVHLWQGPDQGAVESDAPFARLFPFVSVERVSFDQIQTMNAAALATMENPVPDEPAFLEFYKSGIDKMYRGDIVGTLLSSHLFVNNMLLNFFPNTAYYLKTLQKVGNVAYIQAVVTLSDVVVGGAAYGRYFVTTETILISTKSALYVVNTVVPGHEPVPRGAPFNQVNAWLSDFVIVGQ
jgi:hypothetical protein